MKPDELIEFLNPITENRYTKYKSRTIKWAINIDGWMNGDIYRFNVTLEYRDHNHSRNSPPWITVGIVNLSDDGDVTEICMYDSNSFTLFQELQAVLPPGIKLTPVKRK